VARERGHHETSHVVWIGKSGWKDWELKRLLLAEDWVLVTRNSDDFRGPRETPGSKGQFSNVPLEDIPGTIKARSSFWKTIGMNA